MDNEKKRKLVWSAMDYATRLIYDLFVDENGVWADEDMRKAYYQTIKIKSDIAPKVID